MAGEIGRSDLLIVPKFESKLSDTINKELGVASKSASNTGRKSARKPRKALAAVLLKLALLRVLLVALSTALWLLFKTMSARLFRVSIR